ncbi:MAG: 50S ribosomal protein L34 [Candidatus Peribacteria bacterium]|nr:MAG: 50S ribosomal protein L34 [Candidatus Peribacteria bacterium]
MASKKRRVRQYKWLKRVRKHGFRIRSRSATGSNMLKRRRAKGRASLAPQKSHKK